MSQVTTDQPDAKPTNKVAAATVGAAAATVLAFILGELDIHLTPEASAGVAALLAFVFGYFKRERVDGLTVHRVSERGFVSTDFILGALVVAVVVLLLVVFT